jgi:hypothetical protein
LAEGDKDEKMKDRRRADGSTRRKEQKENREQKSFFKRRVADPDPQGSESLREAGSASA